LESFIDKKNSEKENKNTNFFMVQRCTSDESVVNCTPSNIINPTTKTNNKMVNNKIKRKLFNKDTEFFED